MKNPRKTHKTNISPIDPSKKIKLIIYIKINLTQPTW